MARRQTGHLLLSGLFREGTRKGGIIAGDPLHLLKEGTPNSIAYAGRSVGAAFQVYAGQVLLTSLAVQYCAGVEGYHSGNIAARG